MQLFEGDVRLVGGPGTAAGNAIYTLPGTGHGLATEATLAGSVGVPTQTAAADDTGNYSVIQLIKRLLTKMPASLGQKAMAGSLSIALASDQPTLETEPYALSTGSFWPSVQGAYAHDLNEEARLKVDGLGNLRIRGPVTTDEGSLREDFSGSALAVTLTGTAIFTANGLIVTGIGTKFLSELEGLSAIKLVSDANAAWAPIECIKGDTILHLADPYAGSSSTGAVHASPVEYELGTGGTISVANSLLTIGAGTTINSQSRAFLYLDYGPIVMSATASISQRIANQTAYLGLQEEGASPSSFARFRFTGTSNNVVIFETAGVRKGQTPAAADIESTTITYPYNTSAVQQKYRIEVQIDRVQAYLDDVLVADHVVHVPGRYTPVGFYAGFLNGGVAPASNTTLNIDVIAVNNIDALQVLPLTLGTEPQQWTLSGNAVNATTTLTKAAPPATQSHYVTDILANFSSGATVAQLNLVDGAGKTYLSLYAVNGIPITLTKPIRIDPGQSAILTLGPGGTGVTGRANMLGTTR